MSHYRPTLHDVFTAQTKRVRRSLNKRIVAHRKKVVATLSEEPTLIVRGNCSGPFRGRPSETRFRVMHVEHNV